MSNSFKAHLSDGQKMYAMYTKLSPIISKLPYHSRGYIASSITVSKETWQLYEMPVRGDLSCSYL